jgi:DNA adenine methylase
MTELEMKVKAIAPWFGGKRTLAPTIVQELGDHNSYWEPFCGGISIIFAKLRCRQEVLNDFHRDLTNLARVLASDMAIELYDRCTRTLYAESLYEDCLARLSDRAVLVDLDVNRAYDYLVLSWMGRNGAAGTDRINYQFTQRYTNKGGDSATRWVNVAKSIPFWHERLRGVVISRKCGIALCEKIDDAAETAIYADPPYLEEGDAYEHSFAVHDGGMFGDDHLRLATALRRFKHARVVVSYYDHPRLAELYPGWTKRICTRAKALAAQNKRGAVRSEAPEVLLINGNSLEKS